MPVICSTHDDVLRVACISDHSVDEYCQALQSVARAPSFTRGMPILLDIRRSRVLFSPEGNDRRVACMQRLGVPGQPLRIAVLTTETRVTPALQALDVFSEYGMIASAFTSAATAVAWLAVAGSAVY